LRRIKKVTKSWNFTHISTFRIGVRQRATRKFLGMLKPFKRQVLQKKPETKRTCGSATNTAVKLRLLKAAYRKKKKFQLLLALEGRRQGGVVGGGGCWAGGAAWFFCLFLGFFVGWGGVVR